MANNRIVIPYDPVIDLVRAECSKDVRLYLAMVQLCKRNAFTVWYDRPKPTGSVHLTDQALELFYQHVKGGT